jgi:uncharacterized membrane protein YjjP (DUF1212 family)
MRRTRFEAAMERKRAQHAAETSGQVADSMDVRRAIMVRVHSGEITLEQAQAELKKIQRNAKSAGLKTRAQVFNEG